MGTQFVGNGEEFLAKGGVDKIVDENRLGNGLN
jgi:hypothetical protein